MDGMLWLAVLGGKGASLTAMGDAPINLGFVPDPILPAIDQIDALPRGGGSGQLARGPVAGVHGPTGWVGPACSPNR